MGSNRYATSLGEICKTRPVLDAKTHLEKTAKREIMMDMETVKIDDPRLDESFAFLFVFRKGDRVTLKGEESLHGEINDGVYVGEFPKHVAGDIKPRGITLYEVKLSDESLQIVEEQEIQRKE